MNKLKCGQKKNLCLESSLSYKSPQYTEYKKIKYLYSFTKCEMCWHCAESGSNDL